MGVRTPVSSNLAIALGGLRQGVTPLDMAHAYETFATGGKLDLRHALARAEQEVAAGPGPGRHRAHRPRPRRARRKLVELPDGERMINKRKTRTVLKPEIAGQVSALLQSVVKKGTATRAQIPGVMIAGKTGTTENYGDAWFVGWTKEYTVAVWVGYPDEFKPMKTEFQGEPVAGGTYPAGIWKTLHAVAAQVRPAAQEGRRRRHRQGPRPRRRRRPRAPGPAPRRADAPRAATAAAAPATGDGGNRRRRRRSTGRRPQEHHAARRRTRSTAGDRGHAAGRRDPGATGRLARPTGMPRTARGGGLARDAVPATAPYRRVTGQRRPEPGGQGRETSRDPSAQKRHGSSAALVIPIRGPGHVRQRLARQDPDGPGHQRRVVLAQLDPQRLGELPRAVGRARRTAARAHQLLAPQRLQRADQHRRAHALGLADRVRAARGCRRSGRRRPCPGGPCRTCRARRHADVGVARRLGEVVGLGLDDHARAVAVPDHAAQQGRRHLEHRPVVEGRRLGRRVQRRPGVGQLLAHPRQRRPALALLGLEPRPLG